ncbi:hypothetical protein FHW88_002509 [Mucilaginibacter sp. SG538B]|uniref:hypothetical protein n=1 Tax=Mucilaginibacter sp. SG538B TaxID=2587021 RepID=UPI00159D7CB3|nr:hypothetical protein [Mucilaginibacter sp. SG538B]NVM64181.1 hypothetical protein [Mucilaginibacter sp. SG538B]NVM64220.1 hypothetical protein [Mucilaginibacter sp. SG538B]
MGIQDIVQQLIELGYEPQIYPESPNYPGGFVSFKFKVPHGRFIGQEVEVALNAPQFPMIPPSGPYIKPHLLPIKPFGPQPPFDGIHARMVPTNDFQYWSRPFHGWNESGKTVKDYICFLRTLFDF